MHYRIGTRGSQLALAQTGHVRDALAAKFPEHTFEIVIVKTTGDRVTQVSLRDVGTTGIFTRELEERLFSGEIDLAIHSMKDMPASSPEGLTIHSVLRRADPRDALITPDGIGFGGLRQGATVATGSLRRKYQLLAKRPDLNIVDIRGNVDTRIQKMHDQKMDGIVLANAGLTRLQRKEQVHLFSQEEMIPAPTQGILAAEYDSRREDVAALAAAVRDTDTETAALTERAFLSIMQVGCHMPVAAFSTVSDGRIQLKVMYGQADGSQIQFVSAEGTEPAAVAAAAAAQLERQPREEMQ